MTDAIKRVLALIERSDRDLQYYEGCDQRLDHISRHTLAERARNKALREALAVFTADLGEVAA